MSEMDDGRVIGVASRQDCTQFEDSLRRLHALEKKLTDQVKSTRSVLNKNQLHPYMIGKLVGCIRC